VSEKETVIILYQLFTLIVHGVRGAENWRTLGKTDQQGSLVRIF